MQEDCEKRWHIVVLRGWLGGWLIGRVIIGATVFNFQRKGKGTKDSKWDAPSSCQLPMVSQHEHLPTPNRRDLSKIVQPEVNFQFPSLWLATQMSYHDYSFPGVSRAKRLQGPYSPLTTLVAYLSFIRISHPIGQKDDFLRTPLPIRSPVGATAVL